MEKYITIYDAEILLRTGNVINNLKFWKLSNGEIINVNNLVCTSFCNKNQTFNIKLLASEEIRKIKKYLIFEINKKEVFL